MTPCKNCETPLEARYCPQCGQKDIELERPLFELIAEALREVFDLDGRVARTLWTLTRHPGVLTTEFLAGRRRLYSSPLRLYIVVSVLFFVLAAWVVGQGDLLSEGQTLEADAAGQARLFADYIPGLMFVLLPAFALILKAGFRERFYIDHLIHSLHLHSVVYIVFALMLPLEQATANSKLAVVIQLVLFVCLMANFVTSVHRVYRVTWLVATFKSIGILLSYMVLVAVSFEALSEYMLLSPSL
ncbi:MAG: DUF3667 domain-containing protein [Pseudomonadales bacterium]